MGECDSNAVTHQPSGRAVCTSTSHDCTAASVPAHQPLVLSRAIAGHGEGHLQDAQADLVRMAVAAWIKAGIVEHTYDQIRLAADPAPVTIPGGGTFWSYIDKAGVQRTPTQAWQGPTYVVSMPDEASDAVNDIMRRCSTAAAGASTSAAPSPCPRSGLSASQAALVFGFDLEYKAIHEAGQPASPPALIQVATPWAVYLFHLRSFMTGRRFRESSAAVSDALEV